MKTAAIYLSFALAQVVLIYVAVIAGVWLLGVELNSIILPWRA